MALVTTSWADVRGIDGIGAELRYEWNGELRVSQMFGSWEELEAAANERQELEALERLALGAATRRVARVLVPPFAAV